MTDSPDGCVECPEDAFERPLRYLPAEEIKSGDYIVVLGECKKVFSTRTFEPYDSVQINAGGVSYARRKGESFWTLPERRANDVAGLLRAGRGGSDGLSNSERMNSRIT